MKNNEKKKLSFKERLEQSIERSHEAREKAKAEYETQRQKLKNARKEKIVQTAKVISKTVEVSGAFGATRSIHHVAFELSNGVRLNVEVKPEKANILMEGDTGTLTYWDRSWLEKDRFTFIDFQRDTDS